MARAELFFANQEKIESDNTVYMEKMKKLAEWVKEADAIVIGGGSGFSSAGGYNHYHNNEWFEENFSEFREKYGFDNLFDGFYYPYSTPEEYWGFTARYIYSMEHAPIGQPYLDLYEILKDKQYFILTTNVDMQFTRLFPEEKVFCFQGEFRYFQCCQPCHDKIYNNTHLIDDMISQMSDQNTSCMADQTAVIGGDHAVSQMADNKKQTQIPSDYVPRCPECGRMMQPWVRDTEFLEGEYWKQEQERYISFLQEYLIQKREKTLFLELGVGEMTPTVIKLPFWDMTLKNENALHASINWAKESEPKQLEGRTIAVAAGLAAAMKDLRRILREM